MEQAAPYQTESQTKYPTFVAGLQLEGEWVELPQAEPLPEPTYPELKF